ncbi:hypothetical protein GCM10027447_31560 [Glycomyces halotolerans]
MSDPRTDPAAEPDERWAVRSIVRDVVAATAPEELPILEELERYDDETALRRLQRRSRREPLGFGLGEVIALVTPVVWLVLQKFAEKLAEEAAEEAADRGRAWWRKLFKRGRRITLPQPTAEEIALARAAVVEAFADSGRGDDEVQAIAGVVEAALTTRSKGT